MEDFGGGNRGKSSKLHISPLGKRQDKIPR